MKVFIVMKEYDDYSCSMWSNIVKLFSTEAAAQHHCAVLREKSECSRTCYVVEEWEME